MSAYLPPLGRRSLLAVLLLGFFPACGPARGRAAVTLKLRRAPHAPRDALVYVDEELVGPLSYVAARGVRLPVGEHRITVEKQGYFPWDEIVIADRQPIHLQVELVPIPD